MGKNLESLKYHEEVYDDVRYITNSLIRLKVIAILYEGPLNMKELNNATGLSFSSLSNTIHNLELNDYVYRESNKYYLSNSLKIQIATILELNYIMNLISKFFNIIDRHVVKHIPEKSVAELFLLGEAYLIESTDLDAYKTRNFIEKTIRNADFVRCVLPFFYEKFICCFNNLLNNNKKVELLIPENLEMDFKKGLYENSNLNLNYFENECNFFLLVTDKAMILGLFRDDGNFDQNRILTSGNEKCIIWAENLFKDFKKENINE